MLQNLIKTGEKPNPIMLRSRSNLIRPMGIKKPDNFKDKKNKEGFEHDQTEDEIQLDNSSEDI